MSLNQHFALFLSGLRAELRAEEEKVKEKEQERRDLEETVDVLRKELNKTEQARKDASIKVTKRVLIKHDTFAPSCTCSFFTFVSRICHIYLNMENILCWLFFN